MDSPENVRVLHGLIKKHGKAFSVSIKYLTSADKIGKRHGEFVDLLSDSILVLYNSDKGTEGRYEMERILEIKKI